MNPIKRLAISLNATLDQFICQVENHEAVADSSIRDAERSAFKARMQFRRIQLQHQRVDKRIEELKVSRESWKARAVKVHGEDEAGALECVRRMKAAEAELTQLADQARQYVELEAQLGADLRTVDTKLQELRTRRNLLAGKAAKTEAAQAIERVTNEAGVHVEGVFDRWEAQIEAAAPMYDSAFRADSLETRFRREEEEQELKSVLSELIAKKQ